MAKKSDFLNGDEENVLPFPQLEVEDNEEILRLFDDIKGYVDKKHSERHTPSDISMVLAQVSFLICAESYGYNWAMANFLGFLANNAVAEAELDVEDDLEGDFDDGA